MSRGDRSPVSGARRWVVKIGSSVLTADGQGLDLDIIAKLVNQVVSLRNSGAEVVLVSSGAVAAGLSRLGLRERPVIVAGLQAAAAVVSVLSQPGGAEVRGIKRSATRPKGAALN